MVNKPKKHSEEIREYILNNVREHPKDIAKISSENFGISRQAILRHIRKIIDDGNLSVKGTTRNRVYELVPIVERNYELRLKNNNDEDKIWREYFQDEIQVFSRNVIDLCYYGVTEMINNVIDHSGSNMLKISINIYNDQLEFFIYDEGVGIFNKIRNELNLDDNIHALFELTKGKLTTDPSRHTGEGVFFTSRAFDRFIIMSGNLYFSHSELDGDWLHEELEELIQGTAINLILNPATNRTIQSVFKMFTSEGDFGFTKTRIPVTLARYGDENLISRSQAKRLINRFDKFKVIYLDFKDVNLIGQGFADEVFRVFQNKHPKIQLIPVNTNEDVFLMIKRARGQ